MIESGLVWSSLVWSGWFWFGLFTFDLVWSIHRQKELSFVFVLINLWVCTWYVQTERQTDKQTDRQTNRSVYRVALQLKIIELFTACTVNVLKDNLI